MTSKKTLTLVLIALTVLIGGAAVYIGIRLSEGPTTPTDASALTDLAAICNDAEKNGENRGFLFICDAPGCPAGNLFSCQDNRCYPNNFAHACAPLKNTGDSCINLSYDPGPFEDGKINFVGCNFDDPTMPKNCFCLNGMVGETAKITCSVDSKIDNGYGAYYDSCGARYFTATTTTPPVLLPCGSPNKCLEGECESSTNLGVLQTCDANGQNCRPTSTNQTFAVECNEATDPNLSRCTPTEDACPSGYTPIRESSGVCGCRKLEAPVVPICTTMNKSLSADGRNITLTSTFSSGITAAQAKFYWAYENANLCAANNENWRLIGTADGCASSTNASGDTFTCGRTVALSSLGADLTRNLIFKSDLTKTDGSLSCSGNPLSCGANLCSSCNTTLPYVTQETAQCINFAVNRSNNTATAVLNRNFSAMPAYSFDFFWAYRNTNYCSANQIAETNIQRGTNSETISIANLNIDFSREVLFWANTKNGTATQCTGVALSCGTASTLCTCQQAFQPVVTTTVTQTPTATPTQTPTATPTATVPPTTTVVPTTIIPATALVSDEIDRMIIGFVLLAMGFALYKSGLYINLGNVIWNKGGASVWGGISDTGTSLNAGLGSAWSAMVAADNKVESAFLSLGFKIKAFFTLIKNSLMRVWDSFVIFVLKIVSSVLALSIGVVKFFKKIFGVITRVRVRIPSKTNKVNFEERLIEEAEKE